MPDLQKSEVRERAECLPGRVKESRAGTCGMHLVYVLLHFRASFCPPHTSLHRLACRGYLTLLFNFSSPAFGDGTLLWFSITAVVFRRVVIIIFFFFFFFIFLFLFLLLQHHFPFPPSHSAFRCSLPTHLSFYLSYM